MCIAKASVNRAGPASDFRVDRHPLRIGDSRQLSELSHSASMPKLQLTGSVVVPTQDSESAQCVPAACPSDIGLHFQWNMFGMKEVQRPAPVMVAALNHDFDGVTDATVGFDSRISQIIESAQDSRSAKTSGTRSAASVCR